MSFPHVVSRFWLIFTTALFLLAAGTPSSASRYRSLTASSSSVSFGNVQVGSKQTQYETLTNSSYHTVTISQATVTGAGFSLNGLSLPATLNRGQSLTFTVVFSPAAGGDASGGITVISSARRSSLNVALSGTGVSPGQLTSSATTMDFGAVTVGSSKSLSATLTATASSVTVSSATTNSSEFVLAGLSLPTTISAGQSLPFTITFTPRASGAASGSISLASDAAHTPTIETLTGSGVAASGHSVNLSWVPSTSPVVGYNVYRSGTSGGPYTKLNSAVNAGTNYLDSSVVGGHTYYYVNTAVDSHGLESKFSAQLPVVIPSP